VDSRTGLEAVEKRKISYPYWELNLGRPVCSSSLYRLSYPGSHNMKIAQKQPLRLWTGLIWLRIWTNEGSCAHGNELSGLIEGRKFHDYLSYC
jgi:hypothetical protein